MNWINAKDKLPDQLKDVLVYRENGKIQVAHWAPEIRKEEEWLIHTVKDDVTFSTYLPDVTHWMPLPEFPNHSIDKSLYLHKHFQFPKGNKLEWGQDFCMYSCDVPHDVIFQLTEIHDNESVTLRGYGYGMIDRNDLEASYGCGAISMKLKDILPYEVKQKGV